VETRAKYTIACGPVARVAAIAARQPQHGAGAIGGEPIDLFRAMRIAANPDAAVTIDAD
jgi:hypothetical protein